MLLLILFLAIAVVPMLVVGVLTAHFAKKNRKRARRIHTIGIGLMLCAVALPGVLLFLIAPYWESVLAAVFIMLFYGVFPVGGFLSGYFAVKKGKWWIAVAGVAALAALLVAAAAATLLVYGV